MTASVETKSDGSIALFINGDLQFDSRDERIYHEFLALPALALAEKRFVTRLRVLVIGGGDGLVAREILKSRRVESLDLVDYDPEILALATDRFSQINDGSLGDARTRVHVQDAWDFVDEALAQNTLFDIIVSDLTVAEDILGARFHSIDWYAKLSRLLGAKGILAVNGVSPQKTPQAYCSIFNSMLKASLHARPYHIVIPSFTARDYGADWGFFLASPELIQSQELEEDLVLAQPRSYLVDVKDLRAKFVFPADIFHYQPQSLPARKDSDILLHYLNNSPALPDSSKAVRDVFSLDSGAIFVPEAHHGTEILPPELSAALAHSIYSQSESESKFLQNDAQLFLYEVLDLMPALDREQTSELIADFLEEPAAFLQAIDLPGLVARLLKRAAELPAQLVRELELLRDKLEDWTGDHLSLLSLGRHVVTILTLVIVIGNLLYPDMVYAKGEHAASASHHAAPSAHSGRAGARRGAVGRRGGWGGRYWNGTGWTYNRNIVTPPTQIIQQGPTHVPHMQIHTMPKGAGPKGPSSSVPRSNNISLNRSIDENASIYPAFRYRINEVYLNKPDQKSFEASETAPGGVSECAAVYRLGPGTDISSTGHPVVRLTDRAYLFVTERKTHIIDQQSGLSLLSLENDQSLLDLLRAEIDRQRFKLAGLIEQFDRSPAIGADQSDGRAQGQRNMTLIDRVHYAVNCLNIADERLRTGESNRVNQSQIALPGVDLFPGVSVTSDGKYIAIRRESGALAYLDGTRLYDAQDMSELKEPYPTELKRVIVSFLSRIIRDGTARRDMLCADKASLANQLNQLRQELIACEQSDDRLVAFGSHLIDRQEAHRLTEFAIKRLVSRIESLDQHINSLPSQTEIAKIALLNLDGSRST